VNGGKNVVIHIEIPTHAICSELAESAGVSIKGISKPGATAKVRVANGATTGCICAYGTTFQGVAEVKAYVYPSALPAIPTTPDAAAETAVISNQTWEFKKQHGNELDTAECTEQHPWAPNTLVVWHKLQNGMYYTESVGFGGMCSTMNDCGETESRSSSRTAG
jgi:hypothetical protein